MALIFKKMELFLTTYLLSFQLYLKHSQNKMAMYQLVIRII